MEETTMNLAEVKQLYLKSWVPVTGLWPPAEEVVRIQMDEGKEAGMENESMEESVEGHKHTWLLPATAEGLKPTFHSVALWAFYEINQWRH